MYAYQQQDLELFRMLYHAGADIWSQQLDVATATTDTDIGRFLQSKRYLASKSQLQHLAATVYIRYYRMPILFRFINLYKRITKINFIRVKGEISEAPYN